VSFDEGRQQIVCDPTRPPFNTQQDNFEEAELALKEAAKLAPQDKMIRATIQELHRKRTEYIEKEKRLAKAMGGFLLKPAATGIPVGAAGAVEMEKEKEAEAAVLAEEESEKEEEEEEMEGPESPRAAAPEPPHEQEREHEAAAAAAAAVAGAAPAGAQEQQAVHPLLAWYMDHYDWFVIAAFVVLPLVLLWPDLMNSWRGKAGASGPGSAGSGGEF
jgi:hypothetical protein